MAARPSMSRPSQRPGSRIPRDVDELKRALSRHQRLIIVGLILLIAGALRLYNNPNWDEGHLFHPDERYILMTTAGLNLPWPIDLHLLLTPNSPLDPHGFAYGGLPFYLLRICAALLVDLGHLLPFAAFLGMFNDLGNLRFIGRPISALFDLGTVYVVYRMGRKLYGERIGRLAAALVGLTVLNIQLSHFYAVDTLMSFFVVATVYASIEVMRSRRLQPTLLAGALTGLAIACKVSAAPVLAPLVVAHLLRLATTEDDNRRLQLRLPSGAEISHAIYLIVATFVAVIVVIVIAEPYAVIDFSKFIGGIQEQSAMARGYADLPYTRQYANRPAYIYFFQQLVLFGAGVPLGLAMLAGWLAVTVRAIRRPSRADLLLLSWALPYFAITGAFHAKFLRYLAPLTPFLALFAAIALIGLLDRVVSWRMGAVAASVAVDDAGEPLPDELLPELPPELDDFDSLMAIEGDTPDSLGLSIEDAVDLDGLTDADLSIDLPTVTLAAEVESAVGSTQTMSADPEAQKWLELKGFSFADAFEEETIAVAPVADPLAGLDDATRQFIVLKGLSADWFIAGLEPEAVTDEPVAATPVNGIVRHGVPAALAEEAPSSPVAPEHPIQPEPLPAVLSSRPVLAAFFGGVWPTRLARAAIAVVVGFSLFYAVAFDRIYAAPPTPVVASQWIYQHVPNGSTIATEHWEEGMPVPLTQNGHPDDAGTHGYHNVTLPLYDDDKASKENIVVNDLTQAQYIVFFSNRLYGTIPRLPARYPMTRRYYELLFGGKLGYKLVEVADKYPNLFGIAFVDDTLSDPGLPVPPLLARQKIAPITIHLGHADESFSVYDHQKVLVFQKVQNLTAAQYRALLGPPPNPATIQRNQAAAQNYKTLVFTPAQEAIVTAGGTFRDIFNRHGFENHVPLLVWIVLILAITLGGVPLGFLTFRFLPDRGYLVSKTLGVLFAVWLAWMIVALGIARASRLEAVGALILFLLLGAGAAWVQRESLKDFVARNWRLLAIEETIFWLAFFYDTYVRMLDPDLWHPARGGEKPMDLAYLNAVIRSPIYPPYDPWFSGGYLNYYYFGQVIVGTLDKIAGILPTTAYNLIVPLLFALTFVGAFTVAFGLINRRGSLKIKDGVIGGFAAGILVCVSGNLGGALQLIQQISQMAGQVPLAAVPVVGGVARFLFGLIAITAGGKPLIIPTDWYWASTRVIPNTINEFPYFTFLYADLHAHLIGLPFTLLAMALILNIVKSRGALSHQPELARPAWSLGFALPLALPRSRVLETGLSVTERLATGLSVSTVAATFFTGLAVGVLFPINSWDYPTYLGLTAVGLAVPWYLAERRTLNGFGTALVRLVVIVLLSQLLFRPFYAYFQSFYGGVQPFPDKSPLGDFVEIHGLFLAVLISFLVFEVMRKWGRSGTIRLVRLLLRDWDRAPEILALRRRLAGPANEREQLMMLGLAALVAVSGVQILIGWAVSGVLFFLLGIVLVLVFQRDRAPEESFLLMLFATGLAITIGTEHIALDGDIGRMNTVFKFYEQVWVLWGVASAVALVSMKDWILGTRTRPVVGKGHLEIVQVEADDGAELPADEAEPVESTAGIKPAETVHRPRLGGIGRRIWVGGLGLLIAATLVYPVIATKARVADRFNTDIAPTLDGMAYMNQAVYVDNGHPVHFMTDKEAIQWLQDNVNGTPTIVEANTPLYHWGSRISIYTGLPTIIGWDWHQSQQRVAYPDEIRQRLANVEQIYNSPDPTLTMTLLHKYHVKYIIYGELEAGYYPTAAQKLARMVGTDLKLAYDRNHVKIYQVVS